MRPRIHPEQPIARRAHITHHRRTDVRAGRGPRGIPQDPSRFLPRTSGQQDGGPGNYPAAENPWRGAAQRCLWLALVVIALACLPTPTAADGDGKSNAIGACLSSDQVWLLVVDADGAMLANQCVGTPDDGEAALREGGLAIGRGRGDLVCTLDGHPERCPRTFTGPFWHYYHAVPGEGYVFANLGPRARTPRAGTIEAWCYNAEDEKECTPPELSIVINGTQINPAAGLMNPEPTSNEPVSGVSGSPVTLVCTLIALVAGGTGFWWWHRRQRALL